MEAAWRIGSTRGWSGLTVRAIAAEVDVSPGLIYTHFEDKAALVAELYRHATQLLVAALDRPTHGALDACLVEICEAYVSFVHGHAWLFEPAVSDPSGGAELRELRRAFTDAATRSLHPAAPATARNTAEHLWLAMHGVAHMTSTWREGAVQDGRSTFVRDHARLVLRGLGVHPISEAALPVRAAS